MKAVARERQKRAGGDKTRAGALLAKSSTESVHVQRDTAKGPNVSKSTLVRYQKVMQQGSPKLIEAVQSGKLKIGFAYRMLPSQVEKQLEQADKMYEYIQKYLPTVKDEREKEDINRQLLMLKGQLQMLFEKKKFYEAKN